MLKKILFVATVFSATLATAQHRPTKLWDATFGGNDSEFMSEIQLTTDKGFIICGNSTSGISGDKTEAKKGLSGYNDFWIVKTDSLGVKIWDKTFGGQYSDFSRTIIQTSDGGYLAGGYSDSDTTGDKSKLCWGGKDYWVIKISANGVKEWDATFGGSRDDELTAIVETPDGGFLLGGHSDSRITGDKTQDNRDLNALRTDFWIVKITSTGTKVWDATYGSNSHDKLMHIVKSRTGGYLLLGDSYSDPGFEKTASLKGVNDYWAVKINEAGVKQWDASYGGNDLEVFNTATQTADGGYIIGGGSRSGIGADKSQSCRGFDDSWLVKVDSMGIIQWERTFGGDASEYCNAIIQNADGSYIFSTNSGSNAGYEKSQAKMGWYDYWVVKLDASGNKIWDGIYGSDDADYLFSMTQSHDYGLVLAGHSAGNISADKSQNSRGYADYWVIKLQNNEISLGLANDTFCIGAAVDLQYDIRGALNAGNKSIIQMSDASGSFASATNLDTLLIQGNGRFAGTAHLLIAANTPAGNGYRLRVISSNPMDTAVSASFVIEDCCASFARPIASFGTGELYGTINCTGENMYLLSTTVPGALGYVWTGPNGFSSTAQNPVRTNIDVSQSGKYVVYAHNLACNSDTSSVTVTVGAASPTPSVSNDGPYSTGQTINLSCSDVASNYEWMGPNSFTASIASPAINNATTAKAGYYKLKINTTGCWSAYDSTWVTVDGLTVTHELGNGAFTLFPNPLKAGNTLLISVEDKTLYNQLAALYFYDLLGKEVMHQQLTLSALNQLDVVQLPAGTYYLNVRVNEQSMMYNVVME